jgi:hypothetical protein
LTEKAFPSPASSLIRWCRLLEVDFDYRVVFIGEREGELGRGGSKT